MTGNSYRLEGYDDAIRMLDGLSDKMQHKVLVSVIKKAGQPIAKTAKSLVSSSSSRVKKSIKVWEFKKTEMPHVFVGTKYSKNSANDPWFAHMIEGGTKGVKKNSVSRSKAFQTGASNVRLRSIVKNTQQGEGYRKNMPARPFMAPAISQNEEKVLTSLTTGFAELIDKELQKMKK